MAPIGAAALSFLKFVDMDRLLLFAGVPRCLGTICNGGLADSSGFAISGHGVAEDVGAGVLRSGDAGALAGQFVGQIVYLTSKAERRARGATR